MIESNKQSGFTLIELMIVLTLSLFLMLAVIQIFQQIPKILDLVLLFLECKKMVG